MKIQKCGWEISRRKFSGGKITIIFISDTIIILQFVTKFEMPEIRSGKLTASEGIKNAQESSLADIITEKLNVFREELVTEIKLLIKCEVDEALKK